MKASAAIVLAGILAVGVFGFAGMNPGMDHESGNCVASLVSAVVCPLEGISSAIYHISAYASFTLAILSSSLVILSLLLLALFAFSRQRAPIPITVRPLETRTLRLDRNAPIEKFVSWLSLFENSPSVIRGA